jgi:hypothetical protein
VFRPWVSDGNHAGPSPMGADPETCQLDV